MPLDAASRDSDSDLALSAVLARLGTAPGGCAHVSALQNAVLACAPAHAAGLAEEVRRHESGPDAGEPSGCGHDSPAQEGWRVMRVSATTCPPLSKFAGVYDLWIETKGVITTQGKRAVTRKPR